MEYLENIDQALLLFLNGINSSFFDPIMKNISAFWFWYPVVALFVILSIKIFKKRFWVPVLFAIICFAITDQTSHHVKESIQRYRPTHNLDISNEVHLVDGYTGGMHGFFSGHAASSFGLAFITSLFIRKKWYVILIMSWAVLVSYSRIYLGVHYPSDILVGAIFGTGIAYLVFWLSKRLPCCSTACSIE